MSPGAWVVAGVLTVVLVVLIVRAWLKGRR